MSSHGGPRVLYICGFPSDLRAKDLAAQFEKFGPIIRCDIPLSKHHNSIPYAFVEYHDGATAEEAYKEMHGVRLDGARISVEWARRSPQSTWRLDGPGRSEDTRGHTSRASWDRHDDRDDRDDRERESRTEKHEQRYHPREHDTERPEERGRDAREHDRGYERTQEAHARDYERSHDRDYDRNRDYDRTTGSAHDYKRSLDRAYDRDYRRDERDKRERSRSPRRRDSGYVDSTAISHSRDRHSSGYSQAYRDRDRRSSQETSTSRQYERPPRGEERYEKPRSPVREDWDWGPDPVEADGARTPASPSIRPAGPAREA
ncbi:RNA-binding domain-containing protein [Calocera viscosa TUFC12733]|uniref:RNA-binding domain-containing protein n=1 Tax=Calocera viscosa (strain TUFC12733) TaxID=1330018 RepID=A0A167PN92_CALVF|nr:RNA-binding domain-containing protein [Calocera viscosa TUFC12733]